MVKKLEDINKIAIVGDTHLNSTTPQSRIDDYGNTCLDKMSQIYRKCIDNDYKILIITGDIFHKNKQPLKFINKSLELFKKIRDAGIETYVIMGNHDLAYNKVEYVDQSPLYSLLVSGIVEILDELVVKVNGYEVYIRGFNFPEKVEKNKSNNKISICVAHRYFEKYDKEFLTSKELKRLGYDIYVLGHDHVSYKPTRVGNTYLLRPGSLMRGTSHDYQLERDVYMNIIKLNGDSERPKLSFKRDVLDIKPANKVFTSSVLREKDKEESEDGDILSSLAEDLDNLLDKMSSVNSENSIYDFLDSVDVKAGVKERIELYLTNNGIYRMGDT